jgi:hypothetical protein
LRHGRVLASDLRHRGTPTLRAQSEAPSARQRSSPPRQRASPPPSLAQSDTGDWNLPPEPPHQICANTEDSPPSAQRRRSNAGTRVDVPVIRPRLQTPALFPFPHRHKREREHLAADAAASTSRSPELAHMPVEPATFGFHPFVPRSPPPHHAAGREQRGSSSVP